MRRPSIPEPRRRLANPTVPMPTQTSVARPKPNACQRLTVGRNSEVFRPLRGVHRTVTNTDATKLERQTRNGRPSVFEVDHCTAWHQATIRAASRPGPKIAQPASNAAFRIRATIAYCTNIVSIAQAIGTATSNRLEAGSV